MVANPVIAEPARWLGETFGFWVQTAVLAISAFGGVWIIRSRGKQEQRRATVDFMIEQRRDREHNAARDIVKKMHENSEKNLSRYMNDRDSAEYKAIMLSLNAYEFMASGIRTNAFSEDVFKRLRCSALLRDWKSFEGFVMEFRKMRGSDTFFQDFEWLYHRWRKSPLKKDGN